MLLERHYDETLAQASYLIACEESGDAVIIDPNRDAERYMHAAAARRLHIRYVTETHVHADFLSGARHLAGRARATLLISGHGGPSWSYRYAQQAGARLLRDGDEIEVGSVRLRAWHTPGHTPEHLSFLVTDRRTADRPMGLVSGDFLFVGDVGRPDLLEKAANESGTMREAARELFQSLERLRGLPDYLQVWPGHGAGSACGKALGSVPQSTLGYERLFNPALQLAGEDAFVDWVLADQPEPPPYFARMKEWNRDGPPEPPARDAVPQLDRAALADAARAHWVVDVRGSSDYGRAHLAGTINIPASRSLLTYAGTVLTYDRDIVIVARTREQALGVTQQLALIGLDRVVGWAPAEVLAATHADRDALLVTRRIDAGALAQKMAANGLRVIDVRGRSEWNRGHLPGATHIYLGHLTDRMRGLPRDEPLVVHCETGTRASIAASLLSANGFSDVTVLSGGFDGWRNAKLPVLEDA